MEYDTDVQNWLRPAPQEFNITYNHVYSYEPDFVVETESVIYLVEVKGEDKLLNDPDVIAKKKRGTQYCEVATRWGKANGYKEWRYLFIPSKQVMHADANTDRRINTLLSGLEKIVSAISEMRNKDSDAHGVGASRISIDEHHARLFVNAAVSMADFMLSVEKKANQK